MNKIGIGLDFSNICKDYNTVYLDRDNDDPATIACMKRALQWFNAFFSELQEHFDYKLYRMNQDSAVELSELVKKRFFFYSLEKEILSQTFIMQKVAIAYDGLNEWGKSATDSLMIQNNEEGEGIYFFVEENSDIHTWLVDKLSDCTLDDVPFIEV
ncbi:MAG TPA: hypothetical protein EYG82_05490 [Sulfurovum sp.]|nr:hypothetical protein [Sulfurovum sp.]